MTFVTFVLCHRYDDSQAGAIAGIVILSALILSPFAGKLSDTIGRRPMLVIIGSCLVIPYVQKKKLKSWPSPHLAKNNINRAHLYLSETTWNPIPAISAIGLSFSLVPSVLWPVIFITPFSYLFIFFGRLGYRCGSFFFFLQCVPLVVRKTEVATAFGLMTAIQNGGLTLVNYLNGLLQDHFTYTRSDNSTYVDWTW